MDQTSHPPEQDQPQPKAAHRALLEAQQRRRAEEERSKDVAKEVGGRAGPDPIRYGDWEVRGLASDF